MTYLPQSSVGISDGANPDSFSRLRVSTPEYIFDAQFTYDLQPQIYEAVTTDGGAGTATITHDSTNRCATHTFTGAGSGATAYLQTYEYFRYQPGRSQLCFITFNFTSTASNCTKFAGYSDGVNGVELQQVGTTVQFMLYSSTSNGNQTAEKTADWNIDKFNGSGPSGITLDLTKTQILVIDLQALYVGRVRVGFDVNGVVYYAHQFTHANLIVNPYIANANRPIRCGMVTTAGSVSTTMAFICASIISEGGDGLLPSYEFTQDSGNGAGAGVTVTQDTRTFLMSIRPSTTFNSLTNRIKLALQSVEGLVTGGSNPVYWELLLGYWVNPPTTWTAVATGYSGFEYCTSATGGSATAVARTATSGGTNTLTDTSAVSWKTNGFAGCTVTLTGGTGSGQSRIIVSNTTTVLTVSAIWSVNPDATTTYSISNPTGYPLRVASGFFGAGGNANRVATTASAAKTRAPITLNKLGYQYNQGTLTIVGSGVGGTSPVRTQLSWNEIR